MMNQVHFLNQSALWLLFVAPLLVAGMVVWSWRRKQILLSQFGQEKLWSKFSRPLAAGYYQRKGILLMLALDAAIIALARPVLEQGKVEFPRGTIDVIAVVDTSRSMAVTDYKGQVTGYYYGGGTRLDMAKYILINDIVASLNGNRLGVVSFSGTAIPQAFITDDMPALNWMLRRAVNIGSAPGQGSALAKAFDLACQLFDLDSDQHHRKILVLFSDGGNDDDSATLNSALTECRKRGIEIIIAGLGKKTQAAIPVKELPQEDKISLYGKEWYEINGQIVHETAIDENTLHLIANKTGGRYVRVKKVADFHIGSLVSRTEVTHLKGREELFYYPLIIAAILFPLAILSTMENRANSSSAADQPEAEATKQSHAVCDSVTETH